jgi:protein TonB
MFDDLVESTPGGKQKTKQGMTVIISALSQAGLVALMIIIPLLVTPVLPKTLLSTMLATPPPPAAPPPPPPATPVVHVKPTAHLIEAGRLLAPKSIPKQVNIIKEEEIPPDLGSSTVAGGVVGGVPGGQIGGVLRGIIGGSSTAAPPPPPPKEVVPTRVTRGGDVQMASILNRVQPIYPILAKQARVQGTVRLNTVIDKDGRVIEVKYMSGPAMLMQAAMDAVKQWRFKPTTLNGTPVQVECVFEVTFNMGG